MPLPRWGRGSSAAHGLAMAARELVEQGLAGVAQEPAAQGPASPEGSRREADSGQIGGQTGVHFRMAAAARRGGAGLRRDGAREAPPHQSVDGGRWIREKLKTAPMSYYGAGNLLGNKNQRRTVHAEEGKKPDGKELSARVGSTGGSGMG